MNTETYKGKTVVIKYGGNAMTCEELKLAVMEDVVKLSSLGIRVVLVHGGGPEISDMLTRLGKESVFVNGLRVTDAETAEVALMVLSGKINKKLVGLIGSRGGKAIGLSGLDAGLLTAHIKDEALGFVGEIDGVNIQPVTDLLSLGYVPVISTVATDSENHLYNINADTAAARIAGALQADCLISMTDIRGILRDKENPDTLIPLIHTGEAAELIQNGTVKGGMIPKVECCVNAIRWGVKQVNIIDGRIPHAVMMKLIHNEAMGTEFRD